MSGRSEAVAKAALTITFNLLVRAGATVVVVLMAVELAGWLSGAAWVIATLHLVGFIAEVVALVDIALNGVRR